LAGFFYSSTAFSATATFHRFARSAFGGLRGGTIADEKKGDVIGLCGTTGKILAVSGLPMLGSDRGEPKGLLRSGDAGERIVTMGKDLRGHSRSSELLLEFSNREGQKVRHDAVSACIEQDLDAIALALLAHRNTAWHPGFPFLSSSTHPQRQL
jgi:hypothetical protein